MEMFTFNQLLTWRKTILNVHSAVGVVLSSRLNSIVVGSVVVASIYDPGQVIGLSRETGDILWCHNFDIPSDGGIAVRGSIVLVRTIEQLHALDSSKGTVLWS